MERIAYEDWLDRAARLHPERIAVDAPDGVLTYGQLYSAASSLAVDLNEDHDTLAGTTEVAIDLPAGAAFAIALHAAWQQILIAVPIDQRLPEAVRADQIAACAGVVDRQRVGPYLDASNYDSDDAVQAGLRAAYDRDSANGLRWQIEGGGWPPEGSFAYAVRLTTSGTTGPATPVELSRGGLLWNAIGSAAALGQPANERWLSAMPVSHVGGLTVLTRSAIGGTTAVLRPTFDLDEQLALLMAGEATITSMVPTMLRRLLDAGLDHPPNLRLVLLGGGPIPPSLVARAAAAGIKAVSTYGLTEATSQVFTAGAPLFCTQVALRGELDDPALATDDGAAAEEILVRGPTLARGVAGPGGWLATGDRGRRGADGRFSVVGRLAETIVTGGENVAPTEVEAQLVAQPAIADAAVLGLPDAEWGERLEARVVLAEGQRLDVDALRAALREVLPPFAVPKRITEVGALPRTATGKLIRRELT